MIGRRLRCPAGAVRSMPRRGASNLTRPVCAQKRWVAYDATPLKQDHRGGREKSVALIDHRLASPSLPCRQNQAYPRSKWVPDHGPKFDRAELKDIDESTNDKYDEREGSSDVAKLHIDGQCQLVSNRREPGRGTPSFVADALLALHERLKTRPTAAVLTGWGERKHSCRDNYSNNGCTQDTQGAG